MTLAQAQAAFRHSPGRATALAYMDTALMTWERDDNHDEDYINADRRLVDRMKEIRDWLMNERVP